MLFKRVFALSLILPLLLPSPALALRKQQAVDSSPAEAQLAAGMEQPALLTSRKTERGLVYHVGDGRWAKPFRGHTPGDFTLVLLEALRKPGVLTSDMEVLETGVGDGFVTVGSARRVRRMDGVEPQPELLEEARRNVSENRLSNVELFKGDLFDPVQGRRYDRIVANLPVAPLPARMAASVPDWFRIANDGGPDGRRILDRFLREAPEFLKLSGAIVLAHPDFVSMEKTLRLAEEGGLQVRELHVRDLYLKHPEGKRNLFLDYQEHIEKAQGVPFRKTRRQGKTIYYFPIRVLWITRKADNTTLHAAGMEEVRKVESAQKFLEEYRVRQDTSVLRKVEALAERERNGLPMEVWKIPNRLADGRASHRAVMVYVLSEDPQVWIEAISKKLPAVGEGEDRTEFLLRPFPADGRMDLGVPAVVIKQVGVMLEYPVGGVVIAVESLGDLQQQLSPQWIYSLAVNEALKGKELWLIDSIPMEDAFALYL